MQSRARIDAVMLSRAARLPGLSVLTATIARRSRSLCRICGGVLGECGHDDSRRHTRFRAVGRAVTTPLLRGRTSNRGKEDVTRADLRFVRAPVGASTLCRAFRVYLRWD